MKHKQRTIMLIWYKFVRETMTKNWAKFLNFEGMYKKT